MNIKKRTLRLGTVFFLLIAVCFVSIFATYYYISGKINPTTQNQQMFDNLKNVEQIVAFNYINSIDAMTDYENIQDGVIEGYVNGLGDKYSYYLNQKNYKTPVVPTSSTYVDIGVRPLYDKNTGCILVDFVKNGSPAQEAGIKTGDIIKSVAQKSVPDEGYKKSVKALSGEEGTSVDISVERDGVQLQTFTISRKKFVSQTVITKSLSNKIGYIRINEFAPTTISDLKTAFADLAAEGVKGYIFDVRFNYGGDFDSVVAVLDYIMPAGTICKRDEKRDGQRYTQVYTSDAQGLNLPIVVIQNTSTGGVAEIFSSALRDNGLAKIVGDKSMGMGTEGREIPLSNNTAIKLSVYEYITAGGEHINEKGVKPDEEVVLEFEEDQITDDSQDTQLSASVEFIKKLLGVV